MKLYRQVLKGLKGNTFSKLEPFGSEQEIFKFE